MSEILPPDAELVVEEPKPRETITLDKYLRKEMAEGKIDFAFRAAETEDGHIYFYVHPQGKDGDTRDFYLNEQDQVIPVAAPGPLKVAAITETAEGGAE